MARLLLGVSGGIAAYKALEVVRLATKAGHAVRVVQTPARPALRRRRLVRGAHRRPGAHRRVRARPGARRVPRPGRRRRTTRSATSSWSATPTPTCIAPGVGQHDRQARPRAGRQPADQRRARRDLPGARRARDEPPHVGAPGHAGQPRAAARARRRRRRPGHRARWPPSTSGASGRLAEPAELLAAVEAVVARRRRGPWDGLQGARHRRRHARADRRRALRRQPLLRAGWASPWPRRPPRSAPRSRSSPRTSRCPATRASATSTSRPPPSCATPARREFAACDVLLMAAAVADFRPAAAGRRQAQEDRPRRAARSCSSAPRTCSAAWPRRAARARRSSASPPSTARARSTTAATSCSGRGWTRSWSTTSRQPGIGFDTADNEVTIVTAQRRRARPARHEGRGRPGDPGDRRPICAPRPGPAGA